MKSIKQAVVDYLVGLLPKAKIQKWRDMYNL
jgi:hypothetical protein